MPKCPKCGSSMILRTARHGKNVGAHFYGCSNFPKCRGIVNDEKTKKIDEVFEQEMKNTLKKRYEEMVAQINKVWKLEKEKFVLRNKIELLRKEIRMGQKSNGLYDQSDFGKSFAANITNLKNIENIVKEDIEKVEKKQLIELKKIEDNIIRI